MKKTAVVLSLLLALLTGCSESGPEVSSFNISDASPVTGQRIRLSLYATTDDHLGYYAMLFYWNCDGGRLEGAGMTSVAPYWVAPETTGSYSASCMIKDKSDKLGVMPFTMAVQPRQLLELKTDVPAETFIAGLATDPYVMIGGVYAGTSANEVWYFSPASHYQTELSLPTGRSLTAFKAWKMAYSGYTYDQIYAVSSLAGNYKVTILSQSTNTSFDTPNPTYVVNAIEVYGSVIFLGTDHGINAMSTLDGTAVTTYTGTLPSDGTVSVKAIVIKDGIVYAATNDGVYRLDLAAGTPTFDQIAETDNENISALMVQNTADSQYRIWTVTNAGAVKYYDQSMDANRAFTTTAAVDRSGAPLVACNSLSIDLEGRIWNGKYYLDSKDDTSWSEKNLDDLGAVLSLGNPTQSIVSPDGLLYIFEAGALKVWGKKHTD